MQGYKDNTVCAEKQPSSPNEKPTVDFSSPIWQKTPIAAMVEANKENDKEPSEPLKILKEKEQVWKIYMSIFSLQMKRAAMQGVAFVVASQANIFWASSSVAPPCSWGRNV